MSEQPLTPQLGIYGKIPSHGDFITQNLPTDFINGWNEWLQAVMAVSREQLGESWLPTYLTSPIWHFALSANVCGESPIIGTVIPSVDAVGRNFPFTLAAAIDISPAQAWERKSWFFELENRILQSLDDDFNLTAWVKELQENEIPWTPVNKISTSGNTETHIKQPWVIESNKDISFLELLHQSYVQQFGRYCLWWTAGSEQVEPCMLVTSGLPQISQFAGMIAGNWAKWNWQLKTIRS